MVERQGQHAEAVAYYRRCYQTWKKYEFWSAKAYLATARVLAEKPGQKPEAKLVLADMLSKDLIQDPPEASRAKPLNTRLLAIHPLPRHPPAAPAPESPPLAVV